MYAHEAGPPRRKKKTIMKKTFFLASAITVMVGCTNDSIVGSGPDATANGSEAIVFTSQYHSLTRADHYGADAAALLNNKFIVGGFKGATGTSTAFNATGAITTAGVPSTGIVFDNYQVNWATGTAGTTQSNSSAWEYVGLTALAPSGIAGNAQSIKFWDYTADQYDFIAYSTGDATVVTSGTAAEAIAADKVLVTAINATTASTAAYQLSGNAADLQKCYIADMVTAYKADKTPAQPKFQDIVTFKFRALASKVRVALYETVPGYSIKDVKFYTNGTANLGTATETKATLFTTGSADKDKFYTAGKYTVYFPTIGANNISNSDYNKAHVAFTADEDGKGTTKDFSTLNYTSAQYKEKATGDIWLGRTSATASFAGLAANNYYQVAMPNEDGTVLELRVDYILESIDGSGEEIHVYGATAFVPAIYASWKSNYAYTYLFKISDNTNGWTNKAEAAQNNTDPAGLYPITFDAVVMEAQDFTQSTITTVATPSITTYQKGHVNTNDEYVKDPDADGTVDDIFVQVMTNGALATDLNTKGKLYEVAATNTKDKDGIVSEAEVMDALNIVSLDATPAPMNGWTLTEVTEDIAFPTAIPGADGNNITVAANTAFEFTPATGKVYAYVYTISTGTQKAVGIANTLTTAPSDWSTTLYFKDKDCTTAAPPTFEPGVYYKKTYLDNQNAYGVKIIRMKSGS
jgi:hypothetical protein